MEIERNMDNPYLTPYRALGIVGCPCSNRDQTKLGQNWDNQKLGQNGDLNSPSFVPVSNQQGIADINKRYIGNGCLI